MIDQEALEERLTEAFAWRADHTDVQRTAGEPPLIRDAVPSRVNVKRPTSGHRTRRLLATAAAAGVAFAGGIALHASRSDTNVPVADSPSSAIAADDEPAATSGHMVPHADVGLDIVSAEDWDPSADGQNFDRRVYATNVEHPEDGPAFVVTGYVDIVGPPGPNPTPVEVRGVTGSLYGTMGGSRTLTFFVDGFIYDIRAYNVSDEQLLEAGELARPSPDGNGAVLNPATLPDGVSPQFVGWWVEWFVSDRASTAVAPRVELRDPESNGTAVFTSFADPTLFRINRFGFENVVDVRVNGEPAYIGSFDAIDDQRFVVWIAGGRTATLQTVGFTDGESLRIAESLRPVSDEEWEELLVST